MNSYGKGDFKVRITVLDVDGHPFEGYSIAFSPHGNDFVDIINGVCEFNTFKRLLRNPVIAVYNGGDIYSNDGVLGGSFYLSNGDGYYYITDNSYNFVVVDSNVPFIPETNEMKANFGKIEDLPSVLEITIQEGTVQDSQQAD